MAKLSVGGQAVIEGVMMRGPKDVATAVRDPNGRIQVETHPVSSIADRYPILKKPMLRGTVSLVESLVLGLRSLSYSAKMAGDEDEQLTDKEMAGTIIFPACFSFGVKPNQGASLIFETLPNVFVNMKGGRLWGTLFFLFMTFASFSTVIAVFENLLASCIDNFGWSRKKAVLLLSLIHL